MKEEILKKIKEGLIEKSDWENISLSDLLVQDENETYYLEYALENVYYNFEEYDGFEMPFRIREEISNNLFALVLCAKWKLLNYVYAYLNEDIFFEKLETGEKFIDYLFKNELIDPEYFFVQFKRRYEIIEYLIKYNITYYELSREMIMLILTKKDGSYPVDKYINNKYVRKHLIKEAPEELLVKYCDDKGDYEILKDGSISILLFKIKNGKYVIEELLDEGIEPTFYDWNDTTTSTIFSEVLVKKERFDLLYRVDLELLIKIFIGNKTYFDLMLEKQNEGIDTHLERIKYSSYLDLSSYDLSRVLIALAKNNLIGYVPEVSKEMLLHKKKWDTKTVLEHLIESDKDLAISSIIPKCRKKTDPDIALTLRNLGVEEASIKIKTNDTSLTDEYIWQFNEDYVKGCTSICPELLDELKELLYNDGKSDKKAVDALICSYTYLTSVNHPNKEMFMLELQKLIEIKKHNVDEFVYKKIDGRAHFSLEGVCLNNDIISTINHETGHALHCYLTDYFVPSKYEEVIERTRNNPDIINKVNEHSIQYHTLKEKFENGLSKSDIRNYYRTMYQGDKLIELESFLCSSKEKQKEKFKDDYNKQVLDTILARTYSVDEFIEQRVEIEVSEMVNAAMKCEYDAFVAVSDIIDAIFGGMYLNGVLNNQDGTKIKSSVGHGIAYYQGMDMGFKEMIADYSSIIKSKNSEVMIAYLRSIVGDEVVDMLKDVYENKIIKSSMYSSSMKGEGAAYAR